MSDTERVREKLLAEEERFDVLYSQARESALEHLRTGGSIRHMTYLHNLEGAVKYRDIRNILREWRKEIK